MTWLFFAFSAPVLWAASTHIDKYLVERFFKHSGVAVLMVFTALIGLVPLPLIAAFQPGICSVPLSSIAVISGSGVLYMAGMFFYLQALQSEEASVVAPFYQATPLFGYILAYLVLGDNANAGRSLRNFVQLASNDPSPDVTAAEATAIAHAYEQAHGWGARHPDL